MPEIKLKCACGSVQGTTTNVTGKSGTRVVCCCDDCQSFAHYLEQESDASEQKVDVLDQYGGTDIFQMPIASLKITQGNEHVSCMRLSPKGIHRWYAKCCNTPIGNTMDAGVPFVGVIHNFMDNEATREADLGKSRGHIMVKFATQHVPENLQVSFFKITLRVLAKLLIWKLKGLNKPSVFFKENGDPVVEPNVLTKG
ncbi:DUF6151 family protein [Marinomonas transparens]|uniref:CENP-V/GFA domain-containing protein n=1 Tax=Marinomonas transparens TaxID=2795388 RepID=A0A934JYP3_9GAMM|nr:DUF6151 family protein [Marinomonas transparens]MBJ7539367.1 hypothetical protein [Marinomonas transparens]